MPNEIQWGQGFGGMNLEQWDLYMKGMFGQSTPVTPTVPSITGLYSGRQDPIMSQYTLTHLNNEDEKQNQLEQLKLAELVAKKNAARLLRLAGFAKDAEAAGIKDVNAMLEKLIKEGYLTTQKVADGIWGNNSQDAYARYLEDKRNRKPAILVGGKSVEELSPEELMALNLAMGRWTGMSLLKSNTGLTQNGSKAEINPYSEFETYYNNHKPTWYLSNGIIWKQWWKQNHNGSEDGWLTAFNDYVKYGAIWNKPQPETTSFWEKAKDYFTASNYKGPDGTQLSEYEKRKALWKKQGGKLIKKQYK